MFESNNHVAPNKENFGTKACKVDKCAGMLIQDIRVVGFSIWPDFLKEDKLQNKGNLSVNTL